MTEETYATAATELTRLCTEGEPDDGWFGPREARPGLLETGLGLLRLAEASNYPPPFSVYLMYLGPYIEWIVGDDRMSAEVRFPGVAECLFSRI